MERNDSGEPSAGDLVSVMVRLLESKAKAARANEAAARLQAAGVASFVECVVGREGVLLTVYEQDHGRAVVVLGPTWAAEFLAPANLN